MGIFAVRVRVKIIKIETINNVLNYKIIFLNIEVYYKFGFIYI